MKMKEQIQLKTWIDNYHVNETPAFFIKNNQVIYAVGETGKSDRLLSSCLWILEKV